MDFYNAHREPLLTPQRFIVFGIVSLVAHVLAFALVFFWMGRMPDVTFLAAGPGEGRSISRCETPAGIGLPLAGSRAAVIWCRP